MKSGLNKEKLVDKLTKRWPFKSDMDEFMGPNSVKGIVRNNNNWLTNNYNNWLTNNLGDKPPFHEFYAQNFNYIDRFNRYFYQILYPYKQMESGPVRIWSLLNVAFVQSWTYYCEATGTDPNVLKFRDFTKKYVCERLKFFEKDM